MSAPRLKANPVEVLILAILTAVFGNTLYTLVNESANYKPVTLVASAMNPISEGRAPASTAPSVLMQLDVGCETKSPLSETHAQRVRLSGVTCPPSADEDDEDARAPASASPLKQVRVSNGRSESSVFTDEARTHFVTEYLPLQPGTNAFEVTFTYANGSTRTLKRSVTRN